MPIAVHCPKCDKKLNAPDALAGKQAKCPHCGQAMRLPEADAPVVGTLIESPKPEATGGLSLGSDMSEDLFDEMLSEVGSRAEPEPTVDESKCFCCPACHEMIPKGTKTCPSCKENFAEHYRFVKRKAADIASKYRNEMYALGGLWILFGIGSVVVAVLLFAAVNSPDFNRAKVPLEFPLEAIALLTGLSSIVWLGLAIGVFMKQTWAVLAGLVLSYFLFIMNVLSVNVRGVIFLIASIAIAHRCLYWKRQMD
jgi:hypothetical protein